MSYGVYVHIPWCRRRCCYCAFNTVVDSSPPFEAYTDALLSQWAAHSSAFSGPAQTLYFGGGTPSLHPTGQLARLIDTLGCAAEEISLEINPGTAERRSLEALCDHGVSRMSVGVQSFQPEHARFLGRAHSIESSRETLQILQGLPLSSWSLDLIFAIPGQTLEQWSRDLEDALSFQPPHISLYGLTAEPGTPYHRAVLEGRLLELSEGDWEAMYDLAVERLERAGLQRYEISNFARPGHEALHWQSTWRGGRYAGLGAGAHGFWPDGRRSVGHSAVEDFIRTPLSWESQELPDSRQQALDYLLTSLRHREGVSRQHLRQLGWTLREPPLQNLSRQGLVRWSADRIQLREKGWKLADSVLSKLTEFISPTA